MESNTKRKQNIVQLNARDGVRIIMVRKKNKRILINICIISFLSSVFGLGLLYIYRTISNWGIFDIFICNFLVGMIAILLFTLFYDVDI